MAMQRIPHSSQSTPLLPTPAPIQTTAAPPAMPPQAAGPIQPLMSAQPPTHIPPPGFPRSLPPPRFQGPPSIPPPGTRPMVPPGPRPLPPMGYPGYWSHLLLFCNVLTNTGIDLAVHLLSHPMECRASHHRTEIKPRTLPPPWLVTQYFSKGRISLAANHVTIDDRSFECLGLSRILWLLLKNY